MSLQKILEAMVIVPIIIAVLLYAVDTIIPLYKYSDLKSVCYQYNQTLIKEGLLTQDEQDNLKADLEQKGLKNIIISLPTSKEWGDSYTFEVSGEFIQEKRNLDLSKKESKYNFTYKRVGLALKGGD